MIALSVVFMIPVAMRLDAMTSMYGFYTRNSVWFHIGFKETQTTTQKQSNQNNSAWKQNNSLPQSPWI